MTVNGHRPKNDDTTIIHVWCFVTSKYPSEWHRSNQNLMNSFRIVVSNGNVCVWFERRHGLRVENGIRHNSSTDIRHTELDSIILIPSIHIILLDLFDWITLLVGWRNTRKYCYFEKERGDGGGGKKKMQFYNNSVVCINFDGGEEWPECCGLSGCDWDGFVQLAAIKTWTAPRHMQCTRNVRQVACCDINVISHYLFSMICCPVGRRYWWTGGAAVAFAHRSFFRANTIL